MNLLDEAKDALQAQLDDSNKRLEGYILGAEFVLQDGEIKINYPAIWHHALWTIVDSNLLDIICEEHHALKDSLRELEYQRAQHDGDH